MPKRYLLEIVAPGSASPPVSFNSTQPFGAFGKGDRISLIGDKGVLTTFNIGAVEHTVWIENKFPVHKVQLKTT